MCVETTWMYWNVCAWIHHDLCVKSAQTRCIRLTRAYDSCTSPLPWLQSSTIKTQTSKEAGSLYPAEKTVCISYSGGMFWRYVQSVFHNVREWALALFRNNHRACVLKRNTLELIIHWKRNLSIYSLHHLLCYQLGFLYISPVLDWLLEWIRLLDHWTENFPRV